MSQVTLDSHRDASQEDLPKEDSIAFMSIDLPLPLGPVKTTRPDEKFISLSLKLR